MVLNFECMENKGEISLDPRWFSKVFPLCKCRNMLEMPKTPCLKYP